MQSGQTAGGTGPCSGTILCKNIPTDTHKPPGRTEKSANPGKHLYLNRHGQPDRPAETCAKKHRTNHRKKNGNQNSSQHSSSRPHSSSQPAAPQPPHRPPDVDAARVTKALDYLAQHQQADGGFAEPGFTDGHASPSWFAATAITSAGEDPLNWKVNGVSSLDIWDTPKEGSEGTGELGKMTTFLAQYNIDARNYNGHNYVAELKAKMKPNGQMGDFIYTPTGASSASSQAAKT